MPCSHRVVVDYLKGVEVKYVYPAVNDVHFVITQISCTFSMGMQTDVCRIIYHHRDHTHSKNK